MDAETLAREYYRTIDAGEYDALREVLAPDFRQERSDRTLDGRDRFVAFMRDERPETDTTHEVDAVYRTDAGDELAVRGRVRRADGSEWFAFVDVFAVGDEKLAALRTFTR